MTRVSSSLSMSYEGSAKGCGGETCVAKAYFFFEVSCRFAEGYCPRSGRSLSVQFSGNRFAQKGTGGSRRGGEGGRGFEEVRGGGHNS